MLETTTRPTTDDEQHFYKTLEKHYAELARENPDNRVARQTQRQLGSIVSTGQIHTYDSPYWHTKTRE